MIKIATHSDLGHVANMMMSMYKELMPDDASDDILVYRECVAQTLTSDKDTIYVHEHGFFQVRDESEPMTPNKERYNGVRVYIEPEHRRGRLLANFYKRLFEDYPTGDILGMTESNSHHIEVLNKRHIEVARIYILERN